MYRALLLTTLATLAAAALPEPVKLDSGLVTGTSGKSGEVRVFKGIPFAAPPLGDLRWKAPQPPAKWEGVRKADQFSPRCLQNQGGPGGQPVSEDCLYLNIWTPAKGAADRLPVMVWTYGGGFTGGAGSLPMYDGEELSRKGAVIVTYNYRLGVFGFLAHPELTKESGHNASGNQGMMDMKAVLLWVQKNIQGFGGDPRNVTIMGESAGAIMVAAMVGSPEGKGLFQRAIAESGAYMGLRMGRMTTRADAEQAGLKLAAGASIADLRAKSAEEIQKMGRGASLIVDGWYIPEDLSVIYREGKQNAVDILVGSNKDEGTFFSRGSTVDAFVKQTKDRYSDHADEYLKLYPAGTDAEASASQLRTTRDELAWHDQLWARDMVKKGRKAYIYYFTHEPPVAQGQNSRGATHVAEIAYVFHTPTPLWKPEDEKLSQQMLTYWVNFGTTGNPGADWPAFDGKTNLFKVLGEAPGDGQAPDSPRLAFFDAAYARSK
jgi:para-nitrobenzyl esterase